MLDGTRITNRSLSAEPEVSGLMPYSGQSPPLRWPISTDVHPYQFQGTAEGLMPLGSGFAHPNYMVSAELAQARGIPVGGPEVAQPPLVLHRPRVLFRSLLGLAWWSEPKDVKENNHDSVFGLFSCRQHFLW